MFCPRCEEEYAWDVMVCPVCDVDTVDELPRSGPAPAPDAKLVAVFATGDPGVIAIARSLLDGEKIDYFVRGEGLQDLFGVGRTNSYSFAMGPAEFWVREEDADNARTLLTDLMGGR
jgi:hypothetical protein